MRLSRTPVGRFVLGVVIVATAAGCSSPGAPGVGPAPGPDVRPLSGATYFTHASTVRLHDRVEEAVAACMSARGFTYTPEPANTSPRSAETNPYGLLTPQGAAADGYGIVGEFLHRRRNPPAGASGGSAPSGQGGDRREQWSASLLGTPARRTGKVLPDGRKLEYSPDGCAFQASEKVYGPGWGFLRASTDQIAGRVIGGVEKDPAYLETVRRWSTCMSGAGHRALALRTLRDGIAARLGEAAGNDEALRRLGAAEIADATADAACQREVRLADRIAEVQKKVEKDLLKPEDRRLVEQFTALKNTALRRVAASPAPVG